MKPLFDISWVGLESDPEANWFHPDVLRRGSRRGFPYMPSATTLLDGERPHFWESEEDWDHYAEQGHLPGIPYLGRDLGDQDIAQLIRNPWLSGPPNLPRMSVAVPFYAGAESHDWRWIILHKRRMAAWKLRCHGFRVYGILRAVRTGKDKPWDGDPVPVEVLRQHAAELRELGLHVGLWEGNPKHIETANKIKGLAASPDLETQETA